MSPLWKNLQSKLGGRVILILDLPFCCLCWYKVASKFFFCGWVLSRGDREAFAA